MAHEQPAGHFETQISCINDTTIQKGISIFPHPVKEQMQITWSNMPFDNYEISLTTTTGQVIKKYRAVIFNARQTLVYPVPNNLKKGVYWVQIDSDTYMCALKIILE